MASLVADYGESSGDSEEEVEPESVDNGTNSKESCVNFFAEDGDGDGSSDNSDVDTKPDSNKIEEAQEDAPKLPNPFQKTKLPSPHLNSAKKRKSSLVTGPTSSVFVNPFEQAEQAKLGILEKHVRLTEAAPRKPATKQVCFKFKKGKCFLGDKCRFFHDRSNIALGSGGDRSEDIASPETDQVVGSGFGRGDSSFRFPGLGEASGGNTEGQFYHPVAHFSQGQPVDLRTVDEDNYMAAAKGKKRHGVTDTLLPPKKAMTSLGTFRLQERPWTMKK